MTSYEAAGHSGGEGLDPSLIAEIEDIEEDIRDPKFDTFDRQLFIEDYHELPEVESYKLPRMEIIYYGLDETMYQMTPVGQTALGVLYDISEVGSKSKTQIIFCGTLVIPGSIDRLEDAHLNTIKRLCLEGFSAEQVTFLIDQNQSGVFTKGLCSKGYFVMLQVIPYKEIELPKIPVAGTYGATAHFVACDVQPYDSEEPINLFMNAQPLYTESKIEDISLIHYQEDGILEYDL